MASSRVLLVIVANNAMAFVPDLLASCRDASTQGLDVLLLDNASDDGVAAATRTAWPSAMILRQPHNIGVIQGFNRAMRYALESRAGDRGQQYILSVSPDTILTPGSIDRLVAMLDANPTMGSVTGVLLRAFRDPNAEHPAAEAVRSDIIESTGLELHKNRTILQRGAGDIHRGQYAESQEPFGVSWSFGLYRLSALADVWNTETCLDPDLSLPMAELDLAWRLRWHGWQVGFANEALAYRFCGARAAAEQGRASSARRRPANETPWCLIRDRFEVLAKNESVFCLLLVIPRSLSTVIREPLSLFVLPAMILRAPRIWAKRRALGVTRWKMPAHARRWFV